MNLDGNQLSVVVDNLFQRQRSLEVLGKNVIRFIYNWIHRYLNYSIVMIFRILIFWTFLSDLSRNRLAKISTNAFVNLSNLTYLDVSYNKITALELDSMHHLSKLKTLNISGNVQMNLLELRSVFENLTELNSLSMADITNMPLGTLLPLSNLKMLNISGTHLGNETTQVLGPLKKLKVKLPPRHSDF